MTEVHISDSYAGYLTCYHLNEDCMQLKQDTKTVTKSYAEDRMGLRLCGRCEGVDHNDPDYSVYQQAKAADLEELR